MPFGSQLARFMLWLMTAMIPVSAAWAACSSWPAEIGGPPSVRALNDGFAENGIASSRGLAEGHRYPRSTGSGSQSR